MWGSRHAADPESGTHTVSGNDVIFLPGKGRMCLIRLITRDFGLSSFVIFCPSLLESLCQSGMYKFCIHSINAHTHTLSYIYLHIYKNYKTAVLLFHMISVNLRSFKIMQLHHDTGKKKPSEK